MLHAASTNLQIFVMPTHKIHFCSFRELEIFCFRFYPDNVTAITQTDGCENLNENVTELVSKLHQAQWKAGSDTTTFLQASDSEHFPQ